MSWAFLGIASVVISFIVFGISFFLSNHILELFRSDIIEWIANAEESCSKVEDPTNRDNCLSPTRNMILALMFASSTPYGLIFGTITTLLKKLF
jgi:hypothetical protein